MNVMNRARIMYVGPGLVGRTTSLESVLRSCGAPFGHASQSAEKTFSIEAVGGLWEVAAQVSVFRAWLWHDDPNDPNLDGRVVAEIDLLPRCDGFVFVVDARPERADASLEALESLHKDLASRGAELRRFPIVFQGNRLDAPGAHSMNWVRENFRADRAAYVESNAVNDIGTTETVKVLLGLVKSGTA